MRSNQKSDPLFQLIKVLSKAEKRNFRLYVTRQSSNTGALFVTLFDALDSMDAYDDAKILERTGIRREQLPNIKAHLYNQILVSNRLLNVKHSKSIELREQIDFAKILYDKGLFGQSLKILDKAKKAAIANELFIIAIEIVEMEKNIEILYNTKNANSRADYLSMQSNQLTAIIENINDLSNISIQLYGLYLKLGFVRSKRDVEILESVFLPRIKAKQSTCTTMLEKLHLYYTQMWYTYINYDFLGCYKFSSKIILLYRDNINLMDQYYDICLKAIARNMEALYLIGDYKRFIDRLETYERKLPEIVDNINENGKLTAYYTLYINKVNGIFISGSFSENIGVIDEIENFIKRSGDRLGQYEITMLHYKIACIYFGINNYEKCLFYLQKIIAVRDNVIRRDILCFARILNLIASYESGNDYNLDAQIKNVYTYLIKMNDMYAVQREVMAFLKKVRRVSAFEVKNELKSLYEKLKQYEGEPFEQRPFLYLDILSWLQSKIENKNIEQVIQEKFRKKTQQI